MAKMKDIKNQRSGKLVALYPTNKRIQNKVVWHCLCDCGNECDVLGVYITNKHTKSCGCLKNERLSQLNTDDLSLFENEYFKVLNREGSDNQGRALWKCLCKKCGNNNYIVRGSYLKNGITSCGCRRSKGEEKIISLLNENNIDYKREFTFKDLIGVNKGYLRFDFAIFKNNQLSHLIEFNGKQHEYRTSGSWGENFETLVEHDKRKKEFCNNNNIRLIILTDINFTIGDLQ